MEQGRLDQYLDEARQALLELQKNLPLTSVILDQWRGIRLIYGIRSELCKSGCQACRLFQFVGEDIPGTDPGKLKTTLIKATKSDLAVFTVQQKYLNCKTLDEYSDVFVTWLKNQCFTEHDIKEELNLVKGFRMIYLEQFASQALLEKEQDFKRSIVEKCLVQVGCNDARYGIIRNYSREIGLI